MSGIPSGNNVPSGGNVLSGGDVPSGNNIPSTAADIAWTSTPNGWLSANDVNLSFNAGISDGDPLGTWRNKGSDGSAWDIVQATALNKPLFKLSPRAAMGGKPAVRGDGVNSYMLSAVNSVQAQPATFCVVIQAASYAGTMVIESGSSTNRNQFYFSANTINLYAGSVVSFGTLVNGKCHTITGRFNGAASQGGVDGTLSGAIAAGAAGFDQIAAFSGPPHPGNLFAGDIYQIAWWLGGSQPSQAQLVASVTACYGATPQ